jgi:uncharacterized membrane protein
MVVLIVLAVSWLCFRAAGVLGVAVLGTWALSARYALVVMFVFTGISHFTKMKHDMVRMVPSAFPRPLTMIYITGILELLGAVGLLVPEFRKAAAFCLIALLLAMFPANIRAAREKLKVGGREATALWLRAPMQLLFIGLLWWSTARF